MELRKLHNEELNDLYCSPIYCPGDQIEKNEMGGACSTYDGEKRFILCFGGKPEGKRPFGKPRSRWKINIKIDLQEMGCVCMDWTKKAQYRDM